MSFRFPALETHNSPSGNRRTLEHFAKIPDRGNVAVLLDPDSDLLAKTVIFGKSKSAHRSIRF
jgi:hypothetical protein